MAEPAVATSTNESRRSEMLRAAAELIAQQGFAETRVADVAKRAGISSALVIYYFGTREHLLMSALRHSQRHLYRAAERKLADTPALRDRISLLISWNCTPTAIDGLRFEMWSQAYRHAEVNAGRLEMQAAWRELIVSAVDGAADVTDRITDTTVFARQFAALLDGLWIAVALQDPDTDATRAREVAMHFAEQELFAQRIDHPGEQAG
ncbi:TetR family transcriptional regulator C-terminal domain-containing protein [Mycobacterium sp. 21AC1]|uniref:TetR family transcriptional regulator n=1 Tax=[Mycobacterium] appelbergii TaxID=2939269 RepID=UPI00293932CA|nr:TetR family transcriptional regulator [Mycobacterium sp. 21AC1]MDV3125707.1 TetR family transcriptional regulator C-terminal domain-containing protein [Mycobacterium sp. 21AC1]